MSKQLINNDSVVINKQQAFEYLLNKKSGFKKDLRISEELFNEFCLVGYIKQGMDGNWAERWHLTKFGECQIQSYLSFFKKADELSEIYKSLSR